MSSEAVRDRLVQELVLDLVGPMPDILQQLEAEGQKEEADQLRHEQLDRLPNRWYQTGFLVPNGTIPEVKADADADDEFAGPDGVDLNRKRKGRVNGDDGGAAETGAARRVFFPSSIGLSFLLAQPTDLEVSLDWAEYSPLPAPEGSNISEGWQRHPKQCLLTIPAASFAIESGLPLGATNKQLSLTPTDEQLAIVPPAAPTNRQKIPDSNGLWLRWHCRPAPSQQGYPPNAIAISLFFTNERKVARSHEDRDRATAFQVQMAVVCSAGFLARQDPRAVDRQQNENDWDVRVNNLHYRHDQEFAIGHNISVQVDQQADGLCHRLKTNWLPTATVEKVKPRIQELEAAGVELSMAALDTLASQSAEAIQSALLPLVSAYRDWIEQQRQTPQLSPQQQATANELLTEASQQAGRIERGIQRLANDQVRTAFAIANRVMDRAARQRMAVMVGKDPGRIQPQWRPFQLAFLLMNLVSMAEPSHSERQTIDLLFFPTGGGKTEAYLGLAAYTIVMRRLRHQGAIASAGLSVLMRYTLRLLTLDQLGRASTLICALELERRKDPQLLGQWPFEIGLWVGQSGTPNRLGHKGDNDDNSARSRVLNWKGKDNRPIPIDNCPWCGVELGHSVLNAKGDPRPQGVFQLLPNADQPTELRVCCRNRQCDFTGDRYLPLVAVDEMLYRRLPAFVIATVDKFAALPWVGATGKLFGQVSHFQPEKGFFGPSDDLAAGQSLPEGLEPPDLIIQDELHLISGPLGSISGLYEAVIDELSTRSSEGQILRPKIVASTATVRRATQQMKALFGRSAIAVFPAPGPDRRDSFFSYTASVQEAPGRLYLGISAPGRNVKSLLLRVSLALMSTAQKYYKQSEKEAKARERRGEPKGNNPVDPYMTLLGYFNTIKELGITRRLLEEEVTSQLTTYDQRRRLNETTARYAQRKIANEPLELTSRVSTSEVSSTKARLNISFDGKDKGVDTVLATNMISVGLDITRLGLMVMLGQPKTTAEYIQASSRVGRDENRPGLVVVLLNPNRPRDRSHYERFPFWHSVFYRDVEATSVTPYAERAIERALPAITVALARHLYPELTAAKQAGKAEAIAAIQADVVNRFANRARLSAPEGDRAADTLSRQVQNLLDKWQRVAQDKSELLQYGNEVGEVPPLLHTPLDPELENLSKPHQAFKANWSLRDVEPSAGLFRQAATQSEEQD